jgi:heme/copper-type cytochrome/quinol oxidase subunit 3
MNMGDLIFQFIMFVFIIFGIFFSFYLFVRLLVTKHPNKSNNIEQKFDRIIELLEKDKRE